VSVAALASQDVDRVLGALADGTRRALLEVLAEHEGATATLLADRLPVSRQAVTKHLAVLGRAGLVASERRGREVRYVPRPGRVEEAARWLDSAAARWEQRLARIKRIAEETD